MPFQFLVFEHFQNNETFFLHVIKAKHQMSFYKVWSQPPFNIFSRASTIAVRN